MPVLKIIFSAIIFICAVASYAYFRIWQGEHAGKNYMRNEFGIEEDNEVNQNDKK